MSDTEPRMESNPEPMANTDSYEILEQAMYDAFEKTLQSKVSVEERGRRLQEEIIYFCTDGRNGLPAGSAFGCLGEVIIDMATEIRPGDEEQTCLVQALRLIRQRDDSVSDGRLKCVSRELSFMFDPVSRNYHSLDIDDGCEMEDLSYWKNFNSFLSHLHSDGFAEWRSWPIEELKGTLEMPPSKGPLMDCKAWVAAEWVTMCSTMTRDDLRPKVPEGPEDDDRVRSRGQIADSQWAKYLQPGSLCADVPAQSVERWNFWKKRFSELVNDATNLGLESNTVSRV